MILAAAAGAAATLIAVAGGASAANAYAPAEAQGLTAVQAREVVALARHNPGARQLNAGTVEMNSGLIAKALPAKPATVGGVPTKCDYLYACMYSNAQDIGHGGGYLLEAYNCGYFDLSRIAFPGGGVWNDKISALYNHQSSATNANWYNFRGDGVGTWDLEVGLAPGHYLLDLSTASRNDIIDGIDVCGSAPDHGWSPTTPISSWLGQQKTM